MFGDLRTLVDVAEQEQPGFRRSLLARTAMWVGAEWLVLFNVMEGLTRQRKGETPNAEFLLFVGSVVGYFWGQRLTFSFTGERFVAATRSIIQQIVLRMHRLPLIDFEALERGKLVTQLIGDGNRIATSGRPLIAATTSMARLFVALVFISTQSTKAASIALFVSLVVVVVTLEQLEIMSTGFVKIAGIDVGLFDVLRDKLRGAILLRLHGPRSQAIARSYRELSAQFRAIRIDIWPRFFERQYASNAFVYGLLGVNVFLLPLFSPTTKEALRDINLTLLWLLFSVIRTVVVMPQISEAAKAVERLSALRAQLSDDRLEPVPLSVGRGRFDDFKVLDVDEICFSYPSKGGRAGFAVGPISFQFKRGELIFVTGHNGSGKSTFLKMLTGLYAAKEGSIRVDGHTITSSDLADFRALFGTIFVDHTLFERVYGMAPGDEKRAAELLEEMDIASKTAIQNGTVSNRDLSTGQKKRLAMVLTRLRDRPIMLFDEWAADQDPGFRDYYYHQLLPALRDAGKVVVVVTHDDQHFGLADRTLHFEHGHVVQREVSR